MSFIVKNTTFPNILDLLAPHSCRGCGHIGEVLCDCCKNNIISSRINLCPNCKSPNPTGNCPNCTHLPPTFIAGNRNDLIGKLIHDLKFFSVRALTKPLAEIMNASLPPISHSVVIVPLPTISPHIRQRGLDHTLLIAKHLTNLRPGWQTLPLLLRANNTVQVGASKLDREIQATKAYMINKRLSIDKTSTYILLDDVWTTGSSMQAAYSKLQEAGATNIVMAILALSS